MMASRGMGCVSKSKTASGGAGMRNDYGDRPSRMAKGGKVPAKMAKGKAAPAKGKGKLPAFLMKRFGK